MTTEVENGESEFAQQGMQIYAALVQSLRDSTPLHSAFDGVEDAVYIKATDSQVVLSNSHYDKMFAGSLTAAGRNPGTFLDESVWKVATVSDEMILCGCDRLEMVHNGVSEGRNVALRTFKKSLIGCGHPKMAILGITRVLKVLPDKDPHRIQNLSKVYREFQKLEARDQKIAIQIAQGLKIKALAAEHGVSDKTIENRRAIIFKALDINGPMELVKVLVRLQDSGYGDLGL